MISLTKIDGSPIIVNAEEIEFVETYHDTTVFLISGRKLIVRESNDIIKEKVIEYKRLIAKDNTH